jgi:hypothetical protein
VPTPFDTPAPSSLARSPCGVITPRALLACASASSDRAHARLAPAPSPMRPQSARHPTASPHSARPASASAPKRMTWRVELPTATAAQDGAQADNPGNRMLVPTPPPPPPPPGSATDRGGARGAEQGAAAATSLRLSVWQPTLTPEAPKVRQHFR